MGMIQPQTGIASAEAMTGSIETQVTALEKVLGSWGITSGLTINASGIIQPGTAIVGTTVYQATTLDANTLLSADGTWDIYVYAPTYQTSSGIAVPGTYPAAVAGIGTVDVAYFAAQSHGSAAPSYDAVLIGTVTRSGGVITAVSNAGVVYLPNLIAISNAIHMVAAVATSNVATLSGLQAISGVTFTAGMVVLLTGQTTESQNGPWVQEAGAWTRPAWYASGETVSPVILFCMNSDTTNGPKWWYMANTSPVTVDTTSTTWGVFTGPGGSTGATGAAGSNGTNGHTPLTTTTASFTIASGSVTFPVADNGAFADGQVVLVNDGTHIAHILLTATPTGELTGTFAGETGDSTSGTMASGAVVSLSGLQGVAGASAQTTSALAATLVAGSLSATGLTATVANGTYLPAQSYVMVTDITATFAIYRVTAVVGNTLTLSRVDNGASANSASSTYSFTVANSAIAMLTGQPGLTGGLVPMGGWDASMNTPALSNGTGTAGDMYVVSIAGTTSLNGKSSWILGDILTYGGGTWNYVGNVAGTVTSVNGLTGAVVLTLAMMVALGLFAAGPSQAPSSVVFDGATYNGSAMVPHWRAVQSTVPASGAADKYGWQSSPDNTTWSTEVFGGDTFTGAGITAGVAYARCRAYPLTSNGTIPTPTAWVSSASQAYAAPYIPSLHMDAFTGDGATTGFTLSASPSGAVLVFEGGVPQGAGYYGHVGIALTAATAPATGVQVIACYVA